ncbi:MAG: phosphoesterase, partial [Floccifex sp.]
MEKKYNYIEYSLAYFQKKSKLYKEGGYKKAISLKRNLEDYENHIYTFLMDINICLLPVYLWVLEF